MFLKLLRAVFLNMLLQTNIYIYTYDHRETDEEI
jgi:hypothetical protein